MIVLRGNTLAFTHKVCRLLVPVPKDQRTTGSLPVVKDKFALTGTSSLKRARLEFKA